MLQFLIQFDPATVVVTHQEGALTRAQLAARVMAQIGLLTEAGLKPGDRVMLLLPNCLDLLVGYLACIGAGLIAVPANNRLAERDIRAMAADCQPALLISGEPELQRYGFVASNFPCPILNADQVDIRPFETPDRAPLERTWADAHPAIIFYTSGSTGRPKGVLYSHRTLREVSRMFMDYFRLNADDSSVLSHCLSQNFVFCHLALPMFQVGGGVHIVDFGSAGQTARALRAGATFLKLIPWFVTVLLEYCEQHQVRAPALRYCLLGGDRVPMALFAECHRILGVTASHNFGMTEANTYSINLDNCSGPKAGSCGLPLPGVQIEIRNPQGGLCPPGETGEIRVNTPAAMVEYWKDEDATREIMDGGWIKTGDAGHLDSDGYLWFDGRIKHIIICDGDNIYPSEVERAIAAYPVVGQVAVFGIPDEVHGERVAAAVVTRNGGVLDVPALQSFLVSRLAQSKIPSDFIVLESLPKTALGKIDLAQLKQLPGPVNRT